MKNDYCGNCKNLGKLKCFYPSKGLCKSYVAKNEVKCDFIIFIFDPISDTMENIGNINNKKLIQIQNIISE
jgi:histidinol phosphatase-like enzyme